MTIRMKFLAGLLAATVLTAAGAAVLTQQQQRTDSSSGQHEQPVPASAPVVGTEGDVGGVAAADPASAGRDEVAKLSTEAESALLNESAIAPDDAAIGGSGLAPVELGLKVIQTGELSLEVGEDGLDAAIAEASAIAGASGGYVSATQLSDTGRARATLTLRVPAGRINNIMGQLGDLGEVTTRSMSGEDVTQEYVDTRSRLRHSRSVETRLLDLLARAETVEETLTVGDRLDQVQQEIEVAQGRINYLDKVTSMSTITVNIVEPAAGASKPDTSDGWGVRDAFSDAADAAVARFNDAIVWLGGALPIIALFAAIGLGGRALWNRRTGVPVRSDDKRR